MNNTDVCVGEVVVAASPDERGVKGNGYPDYSLLYLSFYPIPYMHLPATVSYQSSCIGLHWEVVVRGEGGWLHGRNDPRGYCITDVRW